MSPSGGASWDGRAVVEKVDRDGVGRVGKKDLRQHRLLGVLRDGAIGDSRCDDIWVIARRVGLESPLNLLEHVDLLHREYRNPALRRPVEGGRRTTSNAHRDPICWARTQQWIARNGTNGDRC